MTRQQHQTMKFKLMHLMGDAPDDRIRSLLAVINSFVWTNHHEIAEIKCIHNMQTINEYPEIKKVLCAIFPRLERE